MIYLDSCVLIYALENRQKLGERARTAFRGRSDEKLVISPLVKLECLVKPIREADFELREIYERFFLDFETLTITGDVFIRAAELRALYRLKTPDALHLAVAQLHHCSALWTNDERLAAASRGLAQKVL